MAIVLLATAGVGPAVAARVAAARSYHPASAAGTLHRVLPRVEQRGLAWRGCFHRGCRRGCWVHRAAIRIAGRQPRAHLGAQDADFLLLVDGEEALAHPTEHVVDDRLRDSDVRVVRLAARLEAHMGELRDIDLERDSVLEAQRDR